MTRVLLYSDDRALQVLLSSALGKDFHVGMVSNEGGKDNPLIGEDCDVVLLDLNSSHPDIQERIECARRMVGSQPRWVIMADDALRLTALELVRQGAFGFCRRPPSIRDLRIMLRRAHGDFSIERPLPPPLRKVEAASSCDRMIGSSQKMQRIYQTIRSVADINVSVLITGQSGTGKELVARAIHNMGTRSSRPFVAVACGAIPETLIEAELFGHEKGAFTGTVGAREGYFEMAGEGTILLDEIGELSLFTQVKLLRVLQERQFSRLGSSRLFPLRARLIFATNKNLPEMVAQGKFREDLYYRMNVVSIETPPLQDHAEDIPQIAEHFLRQYSQMFQKPMESIEPAALALLENYSWPGNVRELENVIQRAIVAAAGDMIGMADLPLNIQEGNVLRIVDGVAASSFEQQLREFKLNVAEKAIREHNGNKTLAARSLCISRAYLHRLIRPADLDAPFELDDQIQMAETG
jgi:DNA-binding NtrC family response regulator